MSHDLEQLKTLIEMMTEAGLTELEIKTGDAAVRLSRASAAVQYTQAPAPVAAHAAQATQSEPVSHVPAGDVLPSPMVGTAYLSPEPGAPVFVKPGDSVAKDQTVLIIEAMKVMNPIRAPRAGTVKAVLVADAEAVEYGQALVVIG